MYVLDLCSGIGGFSLALKWLVGGFRTVCYVEYDKYCQRVLRQRMQDGLLDDAPIWSDLKTFDGKEWAGVVDLITAGFPCQPFSGAGKRLGEKDERNLWPEVARVIREVRPEHVFLENVPDIIKSGYWWTVLADLAAAGLSGPWGVIRPNGAHFEGWRVFTAQNISPSTVDSKGAGAKRTTRGEVRNLRDWFAVHHNFLYPPANVVEYLMGFPIGWTACEPLEMQSFQQWLQAHGMS